MRRIRILFLLLLSAPAFGQAWSPFLDPSRAIDWTTNIGFTIPSYNVDCSVQLTGGNTLVTGGAAAAGNATKIVTALNSCDATHNVVNYPSGTFSVAGFNFPAHGKQVLRGAGPLLSKLISTSQAACAGFQGGICVIDASPSYSGSTEVQAGTGTQQCAWTGGLTQGSTTITLSSCGGAPPLNRLLILDQIVDQTDNGGVYICNETTPFSCNYDGTGGSFGRPTRNQTQTTFITNVVSLGGGSYTVTISPGVYFTNIQAGRTPGAWWSGGMTQLNGLENLTVDGTADTTNTLNTYDCYQCWVTNVTFLNGARASVVHMQSLNNIVRDSYFYGSQSASPVSYNLESQISSGYLWENNIMQQTSLPLIINSGTGGYIGFNFGIGNKGFAAGFVGAAFSSHSAGNQFNLYEMNDFAGIQADDAWGSTAQQTYNRNHITGWKLGASGATTPIIHRSYVRGMNVIGNVLGQPSIHTRYQTIALTSSTYDNGNEDASIYDLGLGHNGFTICGAGTPQTAPLCDPIAVSSLMRWGNYDTFNNTVRWDAAEASPNAISFLNANFTSTYFGSLAHTLPVSLRYASAPTWWPSGKSFPIIGPDITTGNLGICSGGTFAGAEATSSGQCTGGSLTTAWASHVISSPAQDCYYSLGGRPDGSGSQLAFDAATCFVGSAAPIVSLSPTSLTFSTFTVGVSSPTQPVTLTNIGTATLSITSITASAEYSQTNNCAATLAVSVSCTITVTFSPTGIGTQLGTITIVDNASGSPHTVSLTGTGVAPTIYRPTTFVDSGVNQVVNPTFAYDGNFATFASGTATDPSGTVQPYTIVYSGFPATVGTPANAALYLYNDSYNTGCSLGGEQAEYSLNSGSTWNQLWVGPTHGVQNVPLIDSVVMLPGQQFSQVQVRFGFLSGGTPTGCSLTTQMYEVWIQTGVVASQFSGGNLIVGGGLIQ